MTDRPLRVGVWCAVSSKPQAERISLGEQEQAGRRFAESLGGTVAAVYTVAGHSRDYVFWSEAEAEMDAYRQVREDLEEDRLDVIHAVDSDRLGRDAALIAQFESLAQRHGCEVYKASAPHPVGQQTAGHRYLSAIMSVRAEEDSALRRYRHRLGMKGRILSGLMAGTPPYGYEPVYEREEVIGYAFTPEAEVMREITGLFLRGLSYNQIVERVSGIPTPQGGRWHPNRVRRLMCDDAYAGYPSWGPYRRQGEPSDKYPALWDEATYQRVLRERQRRSMVRGPRNTSSPFSGVARCARCGEPMHRHVKHYQAVSGDWTHYHYMRCGTHATATHPAYPCHPNYTRREVIVAAMVRWLDRHATPERIEAALFELHDNDRRTQIRAEVEQAEAAVAEWQQQRQRLALALAAGKMDDDIYRTADDGLLAQVEQEQQRLARLEREAQALPDWDERYRALAALAREFPALVELAEPAEMSALLQRAGVVVWCDDGEVVNIGIV